MKEDPQSNKLRNQLRLLSDKVNDEIYTQKQHTFGKVATIIEATTADPEQRKSLKDLVSDAIYGPSYWNQIRFEFNQFAAANGFELWPDDGSLASGQTLLAPPDNVYDKA